MPCLFKRIEPMSKLYSSFELDNNSTRDICYLEKQRKLPYHSSTSVAFHNFELLYFDIWGLLTSPSINNHKYFMSIIDDHTRFIWTFLLKLKYEVSFKVQNFITMIINQFNIIPKTIKLDNEPKFMLNHFYVSKGTSHKNSYVETPNKMEG